MTLNDLMHTEGICVDTGAAKKKEVLQQIASLAVKSPSLHHYSEKEITKALAEREKAGSTGFGSGIAIPHCSLEKMDQFVVGIVTSSKGVDFNALDGQPTHLLFYIVGPQDQRNRHIKLLSAISKAVKDESVRRDILSARDAVTLKARVLNAVDFQDEHSETDSFCQFVIHIQREEIFDDVLELLSSEVEGSISVIETNNAGFYLNRMPLFSTYWSSREQRFNRIITAVVNKKSMNDVIRRLNTSFGDAQGEGSTGLLITVSDLLYTAGSIDF